MLVCPRAVTLRLYLEDGIRSDSAPFGFGSSELFLLKQFNKDIVGSAETAVPRPFTIRYYIYVWYYGMDTVKFHVFNIREYHKPAKSRNLSESKENRYTVCVDVPRIF